MISGLRSSRIWAARYGAELVVVVIPLFVFWRIIAAGQVLYWGLPSLQFVPWRILVNQAFVQGRLPLWTPLLGMGAPILANLQSGALYPPNLLALVTPPAAAVSVLAVLHLSWAGLGMVRVARRVGASGFGAAVAGLAFGLSGYLAGRLWFITIDNAVAWLPWIVLFTPDNSRYSRSRFLLLSASIALQLLAGHAQSTFYTMLLAGAWTMWHTLPARRWRLSNYWVLVRPLAWLALAAGLAVMIAGLQLLPTYELLRLSPRASAADYDFVMTYSLWPWRLLTFVVPALFGHPADHNFWGYATFWEDNAYLGLLPLVFAGYAIIEWLRSLRAENAGTRHALDLIPLLAGIAAVSILLSLGKNTPVFPLFYRFMPGFALFQAPARMLVWYTFGLCLLAGLGADCWHPSDRKRYWSRLGIAGSLGMGALGLAGAIYLGRARVSTFGWGLAASAALAAVLFVVLLLQEERPYWRWAAIGLLTVDAGLAAARATPTASAELYDLAPAFHQSNGRLYEFEADERRVKFGELLRFQSFDPLDAQALQNALLTNLTVLSGQASVNNFDPLVPARYATFIKDLEANPVLLDLANVSAIVKPAGAVTPRASTGTAARIVYGGQTVPDFEAASRAILDKSFDPGRTVVLEPARAGDEWHGLALDAQRFEFDAQFDRPGYLVLSDSYYPGWQAWVDGVSQPILPADLAFRAVAASAGHHHFVFEYRPITVSIGLLFSAFGLALWLTVAGWSRLRRPGPENAS